jgi:hypothetical protein
VVGQHLFLNIVPIDFTIGTGQKVWCDQGMREGGWGDWILDIGVAKVVNVVECVLKRRNHNGW